MYKDLISHLTTRRSPSFQPNFFIRRSGITLDVEKRKYVEFVCDILVQGRFGPERVVPVAIDLSNAPDLGPESFLDLCDGEPRAALPHYIHPPLGRALCQPVDAAYRRAKQMCLWDAVPNAHNSTFALQPNQGRGSPILHKPAGEQGRYTQAGCVAPYPQARFVQLRLLRANRTLWDAHFSPVAAEQHAITQQVL